MKYITHIEQPSKILERIISYVRRANNQELIIKYLRTLGFEFFTYEVLVEKFPRIRINPAHSKYQFMARLTITGRDMLAIYDLRLIVGIKIVGKKISTIVIYKQGKFYSKDVKEWAKPKAVQFKKVKITMKFSNAMTYKERRQWRDEHTKVLKDPNYKPSKFYTRNKKHVQFL